MYEEFIGKQVSVFIRETPDRIFQKDGILINANEHHITLKQANGTIVAPPLTSIANLIIKAEVKP